MSDTGPDANRRFRTSEAVAPAVLGTRNKRRLENLHKKIPDDARAQRKSQ